jgi:hypothetical protein
MKRDKTVTAYCYVDPWTYNVNKERIHAKLRTMILQQYVDKPLSIFYKSPKWSTEQIKVEQIEDQLRIFLTLETI